MANPGYWPVDGPPPLPPLRGLIPTAESPPTPVWINRPSDLLVPSGPNPALPDVNAERWLNGVEVYPYPPDTPGAWDTCATGTDRGEKGFGDDFDLPTFNAFTLYVAETCASRGIRDQAAFKARASAVLAAVETYGVEREFMAGALFPLHPHLDDGNGTFPNGDAATSVVNALAILEDEIGKTGRQGLIHCSPGFAVHAQAHLLFDVKNNVVRTINGTVVVPGPGYADGSQPSGHAAPGGTQEWVYATGPVDVRRSELFTVPDTVAEALDRGLGATEGNTNAITYRAERHFVVAWDAVLQVAVLADRCDDTC